jgi:hypothetical protein
MLTKAFGNVATLLPHHFVQAATQVGGKRLAVLEGKLRLLAAEVDRMDGQAAAAAQAQVRSTYLE